MAHGSCLLHSVSSWNCLGQVCHAMPCQKTNTNDKASPPLQFPYKHLNKHLLYEIQFSTPEDMSSLNTTTSSIKTMKSRLKDGETLYGIFLLSFSPTLAEICGYAGYDFVVIDMEHGYGGISEALSCLHALSASQTPAILRLPENSPTWAKKALDLGPHGLMFPMINDPDSAEKAVSYCKYPPAGIRGTAHPIVRASKYGIDEDYLNKCENELLIMCQVESEEAVKRVGEIAAVGGVDCVMVGPLDLSASIGCIGNPANEKVKELMTKAEKAVLGSGDPTRGPFLAGFTLPHDGLDELKKRGYRMICGAVVVALFRTAAVEDVKKFKFSDM